MENMEKKDEIPSLDQHLKGREYLLFVQEQDICIYTEIYRVSQKKGGSQKVCILL